MSAQIARITRELLDKYDLIFKLEVLFLKFPIATFSDE